MTRGALRGCVDELDGLLAGVDADAMERVARLLEEAAAADRAVYAAGNGTASQWVADIARARLRLRAFALCDNASSLTARANDHGLEAMFSAQLAPVLRPGDLVVLLSAGGESPSLLGAATLAAERGAVVIGLLGRDGGPLERICSESVVLDAPPGAEREIVETGLAVVCHALVRRLRD